MTQSEMFENAKWIDCPDDDIAPLFYRTFNASEGEKSEIVICGLGFFELKINGKRVSNDMLVPALSTYSERDMSQWSYPLYDNMSFRTYVMKYDISSYITGGENEISVMLGCGYYHQNLQRGEGDVDFGTPKLCYIIRKPSGNVVSDKDTLCHKGFMKRCNLYYGEFHDYTAVPEKKDFSGSREIPAPETDFYFNIAPADKIIESITDIAYLGEKDEYKYYDIGINTVGYAVIKSSAKNEHITVGYAEEIGGDYWFGIHFNCEGKYNDEFITDGTDREYHELFGWQGFRYIRIKGNAELVRADVVHSDCKVTSGFECDNETINWLYKTYIHTQLCNMHAGVPSDCPHRERLGYTGDGQLCCEAAMLMLDSKEFYRKWLWDISDCQNKDNGHVQHTAPAMGGGGGPCGWGGAIVEVPYRYYKAYGDREMLDEFFPKMLMFVDYLESRCDFGLVAREEPEGWCLGDWLPPTPIQVPETFVNSCLYIGFMKRIKEIAAILGREPEAERLDGYIERTSAAVNAAYYSLQQRAYCGDINGASSIAVTAGLGNDNVRKKIIEKYSELMEYDTGIIAIDKLTEFLFSEGEGNLAFNLMSNENTVSFNHMMKSGATTLWENWNGQSSRNHPMFGAVTKYLFTEILGIKQPEGCCGYTDVVISPCFVDKLSRCKGHITTCNGVISVEYEIKGNIAEISLSADERINAVFEYAGFRKEFSGSCSLSLEVR